MPFITRIVSLWRTHRVDISFGILVLVVAATVRLVDLGVFLTADEKNWIGRSYEFIRAFKDWRFNDMLQTTHPGVTTLWLTGISVTGWMLVRHIPFSFQNLSHFVWAAQLPIAAVNAGMVVVLYGLLRVLFPERRWLARVAALLIALNPILIGYSRVAHVDALLASFLFAAVLSCIIYVQTQYSRRWLVVAAMFSGAAVLTKVPAVFIFPFFWLAVLAAGGPTGWRWARLRDRVRDFVLFSLIVGLLFVLVWPALLWVPNPEGNVLVLKRDIGQAALTPHHMVEEYTLNAGHYLFTLLSRTTPPGLVLSLIAVIILTGHGWRNRRSLVEYRREWLLIGYVFFFVVMMTLGAKKGDRYILPVFPALDVLTVIGIAGIVRLLRESRQQLVGRVLVVGTLAYLVFTAAVYHPYAIAYSNPLFPDNISQELGWGEGLEQVGAWLSATAPNAVVASWYPEELGAFTSAHVAHINAHQQGKVRFVVLYRNMFGRAPDHYANDFIDEYYKKRYPVFTARVVGKEFAWVYEKQVYDRIVGELTPGVRVGQVVSPEHPQWLGIDVLVATYSGQARSGTLRANLRTEPGGAVLHEWSVPVTEIEDDQWLTLPVPESVATAGEAFFIELWADDVDLAGESRAPTIRYTETFEYRQGNYSFSEDGQLTVQDEKSGDLAVRMRYDIGSGQFATEEDKRLLEESF